MQFLGVLGHCFTYFGMFTEELGEFLQRRTGIQDFGASLSFLGFRGLGFRGLGFRVYRGLGSRGLGLRV